ncbi:hybrid sensor histidine kinase/response regulator [Methylocystis bryophila]|uniref:histidine kinase n=1 Tax=Methylocystis bryophila TaxID=655015 RepID=A0A1W6MY77_9HYPH|nr:ATP-binding protein [Methylocystis bryophila]ARN82540.1 hypothetical protein B1812_17230 [Methylocystis bryophila]BDV38744.1 hypothetical protein DSM21852_19970 [Methylocystis bryophila]
MDRSVFERAENSLCESEARLRRVFENADVGLTRCSRDWRYLLANPAYAKIVGKPLDQIVSRPIAEVMGVEAAETIRPYVERVLRGEHVTYEAQVPFAGAGSRRLHASYAPDTDAAGQIVGWIACITDITDLESLREADRQKNDFLAMLAHELRNPLSPIKHGLHILKLDAVIVERSAPMLDVMTRQVQHLVRIVDDLLEAARFSQGRIELRKELVDLKQIVNDAVAASLPLINHLDHRLEVSLPSEPLPLFADPTRLAQVLINLLNNAAKFTKPGGRIEILAKREDSDLIVHVRDNGIGIPTEKLRCVFDLFTQLGKSGVDHSGIGLGIGLALARNLVELHRGSVQARSDGVGRGSEFIVRLPLANTVADTQRTVAVGLSAIGMERRVLVVDDNRDVANGFGLLLESLGAKVHIAYDGRSALETVTDFKPEIVFLDLGMPEMDGYETVRLLRRLPIGRGIFIVALSGWTQERQRSSVDAGFDMHVVKPIELNVLMDLLALGKRTPRENH